MNATRAKSDIGERRQFVLPLPPTSNHQWTGIVKRARDGRLYSAQRLADRYKAWLDEAAIVVRGWQPPRGRSLSVLIVLAIPPRIGRRVDLDGFIKPLLDGTIGKRCDQYVDALEVRREVGVDDGEAIVTIEVN